MLYYDKYWNSLLHDKLIYSSAFAKANEVEKKKQKKLSSLSALPQLKLSVRHHHMLYYDKY